MRSQYVEKFNHDDEAAEYDEDIKNEADPIRTGYRELLLWVASLSNKNQSKRVLDLGVGTGNLSFLLAKYDTLVCVDTSEEMIKIAKAKLPSTNQAHFIQVDLLEYFSNDHPRFDSIVSTYAIHHLTESEKPLLFENLYHSLNPGGIVVLGDLMFENREEEAKLFQKYESQGQGALVKDIQDEFFWYLDSALHQLQKKGFEVSAQRFSDLSWGVYGKRE